MEIVYEGLCDCKRGYKHKVTGMCNACDREKKERDIEKKLEKTRLFLKEIARWHTCEVCRKTYLWKKNTQERSIKWWEDDMAGGYQCAEYFCSQDCWNERSIITIKRQEEGWK